MFLSSSQYALKASKVHTGSIPLSAAIFEIAFADAEERSARKSADNSDVTTIDLIHPFSHMDSCLKVRFSNKCSQVFRGYHTCSAHSFLPRYFFLTSSVWIAVLIAVWYTLGYSIGEFIGFNLQDPQTVIGLGHFITPEFLWFDAYFLFGVGSIIYIGALEANSG